MNVNYFLPPQFLIPRVELNAGEELGEGKKKEKKSEFFFQNIPQEYIIGLVTLVLCQQYQNAIFIHETKTLSLTPSHTATQDVLYKEGETSVLTC